MFPNLCFILHSIDLLLIVFLCRNLGWLPFVTHTIVLITLPLHSLFRPYQHLIRALGQRFSINFETHTYSTLHFSQSFHTTRDEINGQKVHFSQHPTTPLTTLTFQTNQSHSVSRSLLLEKLIVSPAFRFPGRHVVRMPLSFGAPGHMSNVENVFDGRPSALVPFFFCHESLSLREFRWRAGTCNFCLRSFVRGSHDCAS